MEELLPERFVCCNCNDEWATAAEELAHVCPATGVPPTHPRTMGEDYAAIQAAALQRGLERIPEADQTAVAVQTEAIQQVTAESDPTVQ